ncbi:MMPL family transporter, partial [bacterium]|nr:MMPL family transporter [bacterium]
IGLGIDYAIHQIAAYNEARAEGHNVEESIKQGLQRCGRGIVTGALTTSAAFLVLMFTSMDGIQDMGFVSGVSILLALVAMMLLLPALLAIRDLRRTKRAEKRGREVKRPRGVTVEFGVLRGVGRLIERRPYIFSVAGLLVAGGMLLVVSNKTEFDYNLYNVEPKGLESIELAHLIEDEFDVSPDQSLIITDSVERSREIYDKLKNKGYVGDVDTISRYLPTIEEQERRSPVLAAIVEDVRAWEEPEGFTTEQVIVLADELERLQDNLLEMRTLAELGVRTKLQRRLEELTGYHAEVQPLNELAEALRETPESAAALLVDFQRLFYEERQEWLLGSAGTPGFANSATVSEDDLTENIIARYLSHSGEKYLVTILPRFDLWSDESRLRTFSEGVIAAEPESVGFSQLFIAIIELIGEEGQLATLLALGVIFVLLLVDFRKLHTSLLALVPLVSGGLIMLGVMALLGEKLNYINVMALPLILGIGIDDSVHIIHRYRHERRLNGDGLIMGRTLSRTGRAVFLTSLTTGIGFGSLMFSRMQGLASMGIALSLGVLACFLTSTLFLPALLKTFERWGLKI